VDDVQRLNGIVEVADRVGHGRKSVIVINQMINQAGDG
jgi:hypothetical protein